MPGLCTRVCSLLEAAGPGVVLCDVSDIGADAAVVDALCRLQVAARRHRCRVCLRNASPELLELVAFMGLTEILPG